MARRLLLRRATDPMVSTSTTGALPWAEKPPSPRSANEVRRHTPQQRSANLPVIISIALAASCLAGVGLAFWLRTIPAGNPDPRFFFNVFFFLFARNEPVAMAIVALFSLLAAAFILRRGQADQGPEIGKIRSPAWLCSGAALFVFLITTLGSQLVFHDYLLTADEYLADFQARIFLHGHIQAEVPAQWVPIVRVLRATFVDYFPQNHSWNATYLPVYAAMRAVFQSVDLQILLNPFLSALTVFALYGTVRNIWPESKTNPLIAVLLLAASSQFLLMSMTGYAMSAHLALNTIWLWLYSQPHRRRFYLAPFVGALAIGLHQPTVHALFVLPFLARLVWQRRWSHTLVFGTIYLVACAGWYAWKTHFSSPPMPGPHVAIFRLLNPSMAVVQPMNLLLVIAWASLATPLLAALGFTQFFKQRAIVQDAMLSCILTFGFYYFFYLDQSHGWGYRYFHGALACFVLVAVAGFERMSILIGPRRAGTFVVAGVAISISIQLPLRCVQAESFVRPYARAAAVIHHMPQEIIGIDPGDAWYVADLIRNDPFLEQRPVVVALYNLHPREIAVLKTKGTARFITRDDLTRLGLFTKQRDDYRPDPLRLGSGR